MRPLSRVLKAPHQELTPHVIEVVRFAPLGLPSLPLAEDEGPEEFGDGLGSDAEGGASEPGETGPADDSGSPAAVVARAEEEAAAIRAEAQHMLDEARLQVAEFLRDAQQQAQAAQVEAREEGFRSGIEAAREAQQVLLADLEATRAGLQVEREQYFEGLEPEVVRLSLAIAEKVIRQEVDLHPEIVVGVARAAILQLKEARTVRVSAHPTGVEALRQHLAESIPGGPEEISIHASPLVTPGGVMVDSDRGSVDARLETQLRRVSAALEEGDV